MIGVQNVEKNCLAALLAISFGHSSQAEPDETIIRLMNDSPTMLDFGIFRLERFLNSAGENSYSRVTYDWGSNRIIVSNRFFDGHTIKEAEAMQKCKIWINAMRELAGINLDTGQLQSWKTSSEFTRFFLHIGDVEQEHADHDADEKSLDAKFHLAYVVADVTNAANENFSLTCEAPLFGNDLIISY